DDLEALRASVEPLADGPAVILDQEDIFFRTPAWRLKLRILGERHGELILYHRSDSAGPKRPEYAIAPTTDPASLRAVLAAALGEAGVVRKRRWVCLVGPSRVRLDAVAGLGRFVELEVVLRPGQAEGEGVATAEGLMARLGITPDRLVEGPYIDLLDQ